MFFVGRLILRELHFIYNSVLIEHIANAWGDLLVLLFVFCKIDQLTLLNIKLINSFRRCQDSRGLFTKKHFDIDCLYHRQGNEQKQVAVHQCKIPINPFLLRVPLNPGISWKYLSVLCLKVSIDQFCRKQLTKLANLLMHSQCIVYCCIWSVTLTKSIVPRKTWRKLWHSYISKLFLTKMQVKFSIFFHLGSLNVIGYKFRFARSKLKSR
jgi:hypothetical protein